MIADGDVVWVTVERVEPYGAWVRVDGAEDLLGLVLIPDIAWGWVRDVADHLPVGCRARAKVLRVDGERGRVSLGTKQLTPDPWEVHAERLRPGEVVTGRVVSVPDYGVFVELFDGVEGLVHVDDLGAPEGTHPSAFTEVGAEMRVRVLSFEPEVRKLRLARAR